MTKKMKRDAAVTAAVFMFVTAAAVLNKRDHLGVSAYAQSALSSRQIIRESEERILATREKEPMTIVERLAFDLEEDADYLIQTCTDADRLKENAGRVLAPVYEAAQEVTQILFPEKIKWAYEAEQPEWVQLTLDANKEAHIANGAPVLNVDKGVNMGPSGLETYYNFDMQIIIDHLRSMGIRGYYHVREDGVKMYGDYIMVAANYGIHPYGSFVETSLGQGIVCDTGGFAEHNYFQLDIACDW